MEPLPDQFTADYAKYTNLAMSRRGALINETILLERIIDRYIAAHFCPNQKDMHELMELIICTNRIIFENKIQIFKILLERHNKEVLEANKTMITDIVNTIIPERNIFAHYWLVTSNEFIQWSKEGKTVFIKFKNTTEYVEYDAIKINGIMELITKYILVIKEIAPPSRITP